MFEVFIRLWLFVGSIVGMIVVIWVERVELMEWMKEIVRRG